MNKYPCAHRDYESRSTLDLRKTGVHVYAEHPSTQITMAVWIVELSPGQFEEPIVWRPGNQFSRTIRTLIEEGVRICGHNAAFEATIDRIIAGPRMGWPVPTIGQLDCTMARAAAMGLPLSLADACIALGLADQKDMAGSRLMKQMAKPRRSNSGKPEPRWHEDEARLARLTVYCIADVRAQIGLDHVLAPLPPHERAIWELDQTINDRGVGIDAEFIATARTVVDRATVAADARMASLTQDAVPRVSSIGALKKWLGLEGPADAATLQGLLEDGKLHPPARDAVALRLEAGKTSLKKLERFSTAGARARGNLQYHAASTGRWGGRGIQLQNLVRAGVHGSGGWDEAYRDLRTRGLDDIELIWGSPFSLVSRMLRGAIVAKPGCRLLWGDYASVEARGCVWAARQENMLELFARNGPVYETMASWIFNRPINEITPEQRFIGKTVVLGCGYGMGWVKFQTTCARLGRPVPDELAEHAVQTWRATHPFVTKLWRMLENAALSAVDQRARSAEFKAGPYAYQVKGDWLICRLPSKRRLWYHQPRIDGGKLTHMGMSPRHQWVRETTWGGKLLENCTQALCRDFLAAAQVRLEESGFPVVLHVHDEIIAEVIAEVPDMECNESSFTRLMTIVPAWAIGFPLAVKTCSGTRYGKE